MSGRRRVQIGMLFVLMVVASFAEVLSIGSVLPFLSVLVMPEKAFEHPFLQGVVKVLAAKRPQDLLLPITFLFCLATLGAVALRLTLTWAQIRFSAGMATELSVMTYRRALHQPYSYHAAHNTSEILVGVSKAGDLGNTLILPALTVFSTTLLLCMILAALMAIDPAIAMATFTGFSVIYAVIAALTKRRLDADSRRIHKESQRMMQSLQEGLGGIRDVLIDGTQATFTEIFRNASMPFRHSAANVSIVSQSPRYLVEAMGMWLIAGIACFLAFSDEGLQRAIPVLGGLAMGAQRMLPAVQQLYASLITIRGGRESAEAALNLLEQPLPPVAAGETAVQPFGEKIVLRNMGFRYTPNSAWVLRSVNLEIPRGAKIGFVGTTGSGKSTLLDIVMGLLQPSEGEILVDGCPITPENLRAWQAHIAHVPQAIYLSDGTIAENIAFGVPREKIDMDRARQAAHKAQIGTVIESWAEQYHTEVGERGIRLSGGQRQRIGIARALYKHADVVIFDEATSALDDETEFDVMQAIETLGQEMTILIIAHRLTTLRMCTQVIEMGQGGVQRTGSYADVIQTI